MPRKFNNLVKGSIMTSERNQNKPTRNRKATKNELKLKSKVLELSKWQF